MTKETLVSKLNRLLQSEDVVNFTFTKKNGETRHARGTKKPSAITAIDEDALPKGTGAVKTGVITYFDLDKEAWRALQENSLVSIGTVESKNIFENEELI